jgi:hypothetical protein
MDDVVEGDYMVMMVVVDDEIVVVLTYDLNLVISSQTVDVEVKIYPAVMGYDVGSYGKPLLGL